MCCFGSCQTRFEFLSQFRKVRNAIECFVTHVQTHLPKTKRIWPMKINVICTVIRLFINILTDFITSHKIAFYSKLYDIDFFENFTHDRTYITLYVQQFVLRLHQHCFFLTKKPHVLP